MVHARGDKSVVRARPARARGRARASWACPASSTSTPAARVALARRRRHRRGRRRHDPARVHRLEDAAARPRRSWPRSARRTADIAGIRVETAGARRRPAGRQAGAARDLGRASPSKLAPVVDRGARLLRRPAGPEGRHRQPAGARHRVAARGRPRGGRPLRRRHRHGRLDRPAGHQRHQDRDLPARRRRRRGRHRRPLPPGRARTWPSSTGWWSTPPRARCRSGNMVDAHGRAARPAT